MILASQSPRRRELLAAAGFDLTVLPAHVDEAPLDGESPTELVERLACRKALASLAQAEEAPADGLVVASDTVVWFDGMVLGKPADDQDAHRMLRALSGRTHHVSSGACILLVASDLRVIDQTSFVQTTDVTFFELTDAELDAYVATGEPRDKAGAYGIQGAGRLLVRGISGDYSCVVGLPIARLVREIARITGDGSLVATTLRRSAHA